VGVVPPSKNLTRNLRSSLLPLLDRSFSLFVQAMACIALLFTALVALFNTVREATSPRPSSP
jgi:hypothetical protein